MYPYPIVVVHWDDAVDRGDGDRAPRHEPARQVMVGWMLQYDEDGISIAYEYGEDGSDWRNEVFIPAGMIVQVDYIKAI